MKNLLKILAVVAAVVFSPSVWGATDYYVSASGSGSTCSSGSPCLFSSVWALLSAGDHVYVNDGTYTGASSMILPTSGLHGSAGSPITISAINDGEVLIDGQEARNPCYLQNNDWWVIEGIDCANSSGSGVLIEIDSDDNIFRRVGCIEAGPAPGQRHCWYVRGDRNLLEDTFAIGRFNKGYTNISSDNVTVRRAFCMFREGTDTGPKMCYSNVYNSRGGIYENVIGMWNLVSGATDQRYGIFASDRLDNAPWEANTKYLGGIGILRSADSASTWAYGMQAGIPSIDNFEIKDMVLYNEPSSHTNLRAIYASPFVGSGAITCATTADGVCDRDITNVTEVGWTTADTINTGTDGWTVTNKVSYASIAAMDAASANPFQTTSGTGARVCYRYENGVLTTTPLWPWPMNQRIIDAMTAAGFTSVDVTALMESIFGTIPAGCRSGTPPPPVATYTVQELGTETIPTAWDSAAFQNANVVNYIGSETGGTVCGGTLIHKILWKNAATDRLYHSINCSDTQEVTITNTEDTAGLVGSNEDKVDIRWKDDTSTTCDAQTFNIVANLFPTFTDRDCNGGSFSTTTDLNVTVVKNVIANTSWNMFIAHDIGFAVTPDLVINAQLGIVDRDTSNAIRYFNADSVTDLADWGQWTIDDAMVTPSSPPSHTLTQSTCVAYELRQTSGAWVAVRKIASPNNLNFKVIKGGAFAIACDLYWQTANPPSLSFDWRASYNGGAYAGVPDSIGTNKIAYFTTADSLIPAQGPTSAACLSAGGLTPRAGYVLRTVAAPFTADAAQNECATVIGTFQIDSTVNVGDTFDFRLYQSPSGTTLDTYSNTLRATVIDNAAETF